MLDYSDESRITYEVPDYNNPNCGEVQVQEYPHTTTFRSWEDYDDDDYCVAYHTTEDMYLRSNEMRNECYSDEYDSDLFWRDIYRTLADEDHNALETLADSLYDIAVARELNRNEFANMIVSFVQDIPYSYILVEGDCSVQEPPYKECLENEHLGLLSPVEFLHTLVGDCDTRTVLLYSLLKHYDYHPMIVNSWVHLHSMLVLDVQAPGDFIVHRGKRYYFWETTAYGWKAGEIPPSFSSDKDSWHVILD